MNCAELAERIADLQPEAEPRDVARLCLLLSNAVDTIDDLDDANSLAQIWQEVGWRLQAATDQHAAMTEELETLARSDPRKFTPDQIWVLIRAIKVQSQVLRLYVGDTAPIVE
ncbi:MAG: hypothetical protein R3B96_16020 [Pirellulaceae bacterium]|nr:hypothetical protein [Planctomycetales bacterium]